MTASAPGSRPMTPREWVMLLALSGVFGASFFFNGIAVRGLPVLTIVGLRVTLAALILLTVLQLRGLSLPKAGRVWAAFLVMGALNNAIPFSLIVWGQQHIGAGLAAILNAATPLFTVLLAHVVTRDERMTGGKLAGVLLGLAGVAVLIGPAALRDLGTQVLAQGLCLAGALSYACAGLYGRRFRAMGISPLGTATGQLLASSAILLPLALILDRPWLLSPPGAAALAAVAGLAVLSTALAYVLYFRILATAGATNLVLVTFLVPVSAILLGTLLLGETLLPRQIAGMGLIGLGLAAIDGRLLRRWRAAGGADRPIAARPPRT